jgi:tRNA A-37 threonylcarbamoyl transferase component Bud32
MIGRVIGTYKIESKIGEGGMGSVYKGIDTMLDRDVAIKALRPELVSQTSIVERFRKEAVTLAKLNHPNIATLYQLIREGNELYMVLEYVKGESLDEILRRRGWLETDEFIPVFCQILDGIDHAHELGIIHRDIKPGNMMLTETGQLKVLDFGIARLLGSSRMTRAGNIIGTLEYMAPEQVRGLETDARSDIYALGMMLYEVLTGRAPFDTENEFELMKLQTETLPEPPRSLKPAIPEAVDEAIMRSVQKDPDQRFQTAGDFREAFLDAGFAGRGAMRRPTGPGLGRGAGTPTPVPEPVDTAEAGAISVPDVVKETRFEPAPVMSAPAVELKETRFAPQMQPVAESPIDPSIGATEKAGGLMTRLTWVHFAAIGAFVVIAFAFVFVGGLMVVGGSFSAANTATANTNGTPANANTNTSVIAPATPRRIEAPVSISTPEPRPVEPIELAPVSTPEPPRDPSTKRTATPRPTIRKTPPKTPSAKCALTGDC